jgi:autotransporter-associated beta strand protein
MGFFSLRQWLNRKSRSRRSPSHRLPRLSRKLELEDLETRLAPATHNWTGVGGDGLWSNPANWTGGFVPTGGLDTDGHYADLVFGTGVLAANRATHNDLPAPLGGGPLIFNSIVIDANASNYSFDGEAITLGNSTGLATGFITVGVGSLSNTISLDINLGGQGGTDQNITVNSGASLTIGDTTGLLGHISGTTGSNLTKDGVGTLTLTTDNSGFTGRVKINAGIVTIENPNSLGTGANTTVAANAQLQVQGSGLVVTEHLILNGPGIQNSGALLNATGSGANTWAGPIELDSDTTLGANTGSLNISGQISDLGAGRNLTKEGLGQIIFSHVGGNTYRGLTTINSGILTIEDPLSLGPDASGGGGTAASGTIVNQFGGETGTLQLLDPNFASDGGGFTVKDEVLTLNGTGVNGTTTTTFFGAKNIGALNNLQGNNTWAGPVTLGSPVPNGSDVNIGVSAAPLPVAVPIDPAGASETGSTVTILTTAPHGFSVGQTVVISGVGVDGYNGTFTITSVPTTTTFTYTDSATGLAASGGGSASLPPAPSSLTISGVVGDVTPPSGPFKLIKVDVGELILNNSNTYQAATDVEMGILDVRDSQALGPVGKLGTTTVQVGASLALEVDTGFDAHGRDLSIDSITGTTGNGPQLGLTFADSLIINGTGIDNTLITPTGPILAHSGALHSISGINKWTGPIALGGSATDASIGVEPDPHQSFDDNYFTHDYSLTVTGVISGGNLTNFEKFDNGQLILPTPNTYTGLTFINQGWVTVQNDQALGARIPGIGDTVQPPAFVANGAAIHLKPLTAAIAGATEVGATVTITTLTPHNFTVGETVQIANVGVAGYNGNFTISSVPTPTSFTYAATQSGLAPSAGGTATETSLHLAKNLVLSGDGITHNFGLISQKGALLNLGGANTVGSQTIIDPELGAVVVSSWIQLEQAVGIGVENPDPLFPVSDLSVTATVADLKPFVVRGVISGPHEDPNVLPTMFPSGKVTLNYSGFGAPNDLQVYYPPRGLTGATVLFDSATTTPSGSKTVTYPGGGPAPSALFEIVANPGGGGTFGWSYTATVTPDNPGGGGITKLGSQTLRLQGDGTYTGPVEVAQGTLVAQNDSALGHSTSGTAATSAPGTESFTTTNTTVDAGGALGLATSIASLNGGIAAGIQVYDEHLILNGAGQQVAVAGTTGDSFTLTFNGQTTTSLSVTSPTLAADMQTALNLLSSIGGLPTPGSVTVTQGSGPNSNVYTVVFGGSLTEANNPLMSATPAGDATVVVSGTNFLGNNLPLVNISGDNMWRGPVTLNASTPIDTTFNSRLTLAGTIDDQQSLQTLTLPSGVGEFTLTFNGQTTTALNLSDPNLAADIATALNALSSIGGVGGSVAVTQSPTNPLVFTVAFGGTLASNSTLLVATGIVTPNPVVIAGPGTSQTLTVPSAGPGLFTLTFKSQTTSVLDLASSTLAADITSALDALSSIGGASGSVTVTQSPTNPLVFTIAFAGSLTGTQPLITGTGIATPNPMVVSPNAADLIKLDTGELVLAGSNTYRGVTHIGLSANLGDTSTLSGGILTIENSHALGAITGGTEVANGSTLQLQGNVTIAGEPLTIQGTGPGVGSVPTNVPVRWFNVGPAPINNGQTPGNQASTGRVTGVAVDPTDSNVMYISTAGGGAWKTINDGQTWVQLFDSAPVQRLSLPGTVGTFTLTFQGQTTAPLDLSSPTLAADIQGALNGLSSIGGLTPVAGSVTVTQDTTDPLLFNVTFAGALSGTTIPALSATGLAGTSSPQVNVLPTDLYTGAIAIDPHDPRIIYLGTGEADSSVSGLSNSPDSFYGTGVYVSRDSGRTWSLLTNTDGTNPLFGLAVSKIVVDPGSFGGAEVAPFTSPYPSLLSTGRIYVATSDVVANAPVQAVAPTPGVYRFDTSTTQVQALTVPTLTGPGSFKITFTNPLTGITDTTGSISLAGLTAAILKADIGGLASVGGTANVDVTQSIDPTTGLPVNPLIFNVAFIGSLAAQPEPYPGSPIPLTNYSTVHLDLPLDPPLMTVTGSTPAATPVVSPASTWVNLTGTTSGNRASNLGQQTSPPRSPGPDDDFRMSFPQSGVTWSDLTLQYFDNTNPPTGTRPSPGVEPGEALMVPVLYAALGTVTGNDSNAVFRTEQPMFAAESSKPTIWFVGDPGVPKDEIQQITVKPIGDPTLVYELAFKGNAFVNHTPTSGPNELTSASDAALLEADLNALGSIGGIGGHVTVTLDASSTVTTNVFDVEWDQASADSPQPLITLVANSSALSVGIGEAQAGAGIDTESGGEFPAGPFFGTPLNGNIKVTSVVAPNPNGDNPNFLTAGQVILYASITVPTDHGGFLDTVAYPTTHGQLRDIAVSTTGGRSWSLLGTAPNYMGANTPTSHAMGWYDSSILATSPTTVFVAGNETDTVAHTGGILMSTDSGTTWTDISSLPAGASGTGPHSGFHALTQNGQNVVVGTDGGVWEFNTVTKLWSDRNGNLADALLNGVSASANDPNTSLAGTQGNGIEVQGSTVTAPGSPAWTRTDPPATSDPAANISGDGGQVHFDPKNPLIAYAVHVLNGTGIPSPDQKTSVNGFLDKSTDGGKTWALASPPGPNSLPIDFNGYFPFVVDPVNTSRILAGGSSRSQPGQAADSLFESLDGGVTWTGIKNVPISHVTAIGLATYQGNFASDPGFPLVTDAGANTYDPNTIYITDGNQVFVTKDHGQSWAPGATTTDIIGAGATEAGTTVTITTKAPHGFSVGQTVTIAGVSALGYNGTFAISSVPTPTTFTYTDSFTLLPHSGGGTASATASIAASPTGATESGSTVTITTTAAHGFTAGQTVTIAGVGVAGYNGTFTITSVPTPTSFTYTDTATGLAGSGGGSAMVSAAITHGASEVGTTVTITTPVPHGAVVGETVRISGTGSAYDGTFKITSVPTPTTFTYTDVAGLGSIDPTGATAVLLRTPALSLSGTTIQAIAVDPGNRDTIYIVTNQFAGVTGKARVFRSTDAGQTWTDISAGLPDLPAWTIAVDPRTDNPTTLGQGTVYIGNDDGVWQRLPGGTWTRFGAGMPHVQVHYLEVNQALNTLTAATYGRSLFQLFFSDVPPNSPFATDTIVSSPNGATESGSTVTITTTATHGFQVGETVQISGVAAVAYNGTFTITSVPTANSFTYTSTTLGLPSSGGGVVSLLTPVYGALRASSGSSVWAGPIQLVGGGNAPITNEVVIAAAGSQSVQNGISAAQIDIRGQISDLVPGSNPLLAKFGHGNVILSGANTYGGVTEVKEGVLTVNNPLGLGGVSSVGISASPTGATEAGSTATITTSAAHGFSVGQIVQISGVGVAGYNGSFTITSVPTPTTFTYTATATGLAASGGGTASVVTTQTPAVQTLTFNGAPTTFNLFFGNAGPVSFTYNGDSTDLQNLLTALQTLIPTANLQAADLTQGTGVNSNVFTVTLRGVLAGFQQPLIAATPTSGTGSFVAQVVSQGAGGTVVDPGTALELESDLALERVQLNGDGVLFNGHFQGALRNKSGKNTFTGTLILNTNSTIGVDSGGFLTIGAKLIPGVPSSVGTITDGGANRSFTKELTGTLILASADTYGGVATVNQGALQVQNSLALSGSSTEVKDGAQLQMQTPPTETLTVTGTSGSFTLGFNGSTTGSLFVASPTLAADIQTALNGLPSILSVGGVVTVTQAGNVFTVAFQGALDSANPTPLVATVTGSATVTVNPLAGTPVVVVNEPLTLSGTGIFNTGALLNTGGNNTWQGPITFTSDPVLLTPASLGFATIPPVNVAIGTANVGETLTINGPIGQVAPGVGVPVGAGVQFGLIKAGPGRLTLGQFTSTDSYKGFTTVAAGTLRLQTSGTPLGTTNVPTTVNSGAALELDGDPITVSEPLILNGYGPAALQFIALTATSGTFTLTFTYNGTTSTTNALSVASPTLAADIQNALNSLASIQGVNSSVTVTQTATGFQVAFAGTLATVIVPPMTASGPATVSVILPGGQGALRNVTGNNTYLAPITLQSDSSVEVDPTTTLTIQGNIQDPTPVPVEPASFTKFGPGTLVYPNANTYSGTTIVNNGILNIQNNASVNAGGPLNGGAEIETVSLFGPNGTFNLTFNGSTTGPLPLNIPASGGVGPTGSMQNALNALPSINGVGGNVVVTQSGNVYTVVFQGSLQFLDVPTLTSSTVSGGATAVIATVQDGPGGTVVNSGGTLQVQNNITVSTGSLTLSGTGTAAQQLIALSSSSGTFTLTFNGATTAALNAASPTLAADIQTALNGLASIGGAGGSVSVTQTISGYFVVFGGSLATVTVPPITATGPASVSVLQPGARGALENVGGFSDNWASPVILGPNATIGVDNVADKLTLSQTITDNGLGLGVTKVGPGTMIYAGGASTPNTYTGLTSVLDGALQLNKTGAIAVAGNLSVGDSPEIDSTPGIDTVQLEQSSQLANTSTVTVASDGLFDLNKNNQTIAGLNMTGGTVDVNGGTLTLAGNVTATSDTNDNPAVIKDTLGTGRVSLGAATRTFTVNGPGTTGAPDLTVPALISGMLPTDGLTKAGNGIFQIPSSVHEAYTGLTSVNAGTLQVDGTLGPQGGPYNPVALTGGILDGTGQVGTVTSGAPVAPSNVSTMSAGHTVPGIVSGNTTAGILTVNGSLTWNPQTNFYVQLDGADRGPGFSDQVVVNGPVNLGSAKLTGAVVAPYTAPAGSSFVILQSTGTISGQFAQGGNNSIIFLGAAKFTLTINNNGPTKTVILTRLTSTTTTTVTEAPASGVPNTIYAITATISPEPGGSGPIFGHVNFVVTGPSGDTAYNNIPVVGSTATLQLQGLPVGSYTVKSATFVSDDPLITATPPTTLPSFTVVKDTTVTSTPILVAPNNASPSVYGQPLTFQVTVSPHTPGGPVGTLYPSGTVNFVDGSSLIGSATLNAVGVATFTIPSTTASIAVSPNGATESGTTATITTTAAHGLTAGETVQIWGVGVAGYNGLFTVLTVTSTTFTYNPGVTGLANSGGGTVLGVISVGTHHISASYLGDSNYFASSSSGSLSQTVTKAGTTITVASPAGSAVYGAAPITATVAPQFLGGPTGTVTFFNNGLAIETDPVLSVGGSQVATLKPLSPGNYHITATYSGDTDFLPNAVSNTIPQTVLQAQTTVQVSSSSNPSIFGQPVVFTGTISPVPPGASQPGSLLPSGTANLIIDGAPVQSNVAVVSGVVNFAAINNLPIAGSPHSVQIVYNGDTNYSGNNNTLSPGQTVTPAPTTTSVTSNHNPSVFGQSVTFTAVVSASPSTQTPDGTLAWVIDGSQVASDTLVNGTDTFTISTLSVSGSPHTVSVTYTPSASGNFTGSSGSLSGGQTVNKDQTTTTVSSSSTNNTSSYGQTVTFTATVSANSPGSGTASGTVNFYDNVQDAAHLLGTGTLNQNAASDRASYTTTALQLTGGSHTLFAVYQGDGSFVTSTGSLTQTVNKDGTNTTDVRSSIPLGAVYGVPITLSATVSSQVAGVGVPTGTINFYDGAVAANDLLGSGTVDVTGKASLTLPSTSPVLPALPAGTHTLIAVYQGDTNFLTSTSPTPQTIQVVTQATTNTTVASDHTTAVYGQETITATVADTSSGSTGTPTGSVIFTIKVGTTTLPSQTIALVNGVATLTSPSTPSSVLTELTAGGPSGTTYSISAAYQGDNNFFTSGSNTISQTVNQDQSTTVLTASPAGGSVAGQQVTFTATVSASSPGAGFPTGTVNFFDGSNPIGSQTLNLVSGQEQASIQISSLAVSSSAHQISAVYQGDNNFVTSPSNTVSYTVGKANTGTTVSSSLPTSTYGQSVTFTGTVAVSTPGTGTATGNVNFYMDVVDNAHFLGFGTLNQSATDTASYTTTTTQLTGGNHTIFAVYQGDSNFNTSQGTTPQTVQQVNTNTVLNAATPTFIVGRPLSVTATVTPTTSGLSLTGGTVSFTVDSGAPVVVPVNLATDQAVTTVTISTLGSHTIHATYSGDGSFTGSTASPVTVTGLTHNGGFVAQVYRDLLHREPDLPGLLGWQNALDQGLLTRTQFVFALESSTEYRSDVVDALYVHYLHRHADPGGLSGYVNAMAHGFTDEQVAASLAGSDEYFINRGGSTVDGFITVLYLDALNRQPDPPGRQAFEQALSFHVSRQQVASAVLGSFEYKSDLVFGYYTSFLHRSPDPAGQNAWANAMTQGLTDEQVIALIIGSDEYFNNL